MKLEWIQTDRENSDFTALCQLLNRELVLKLSGSGDPISSRADKTDDFETVLLAKTNLVPVACAALRPFSTDTAELKRMYVLPERRNHGLGSILLGKCEEIARYRNYRFLVLETNILLPDAKRLYEKNGYVKRASYGPFASLQETICMQKALF